jgi:nucleotide-binding universal stress UspA family protein
MIATKAPARISVRNILYATDFSPAAEAAAAYAAELARRYGSKIFALHVRPLQGYGMAPPESWPALREAWELQAKEQAGHLSRLFQSVEHESIVAEGEVWDEISKLIKQDDIDLAVIGTRGREGLGKILLGSIAEGILRRAACPVLTVGPHVQVDAARATQMKRILFATDFSPASHAAALYAISLAQENQAHLDILHVVENRKTGELVGTQELILGTVDRMRGLLPPEAELWCEPAFVVEAGDPAGLVLQSARERNSDAIVIGVKRVKSELAASDHFPWSVAHKIIAGAACPVLTVRG